MNAADIVLAGNKDLAKQMAEKDAEIERLKATIQKQGDTREMSVEALAQRQTQGCCYDCGRKYGDAHGFPDLVVPDETWLKITPTGHGGGLLCPSCMCRRAHDAGLEHVPAVFKSGPLCVPFCVSDSCYRPESGREAEIRSMLAMIDAGYSIEAGKIAGAARHLLALLDAVKAEKIWRPADEWHEDFGDAIWCRAPVTEPYHAGSPLGDDWPDDYYTHFILMRDLPEPPR